MNRTLRIGVPALVALALMVGMSAMTISAADHLDAPIVKLNGKVDINDVYVFHPGVGARQNLDKTVFIMTVNPAAGVISGDKFQTGRAYALHIDTDGDAWAEATIWASFGAVDRNGRQTVKITYEAEGWRHTPTATGRTGSTFAAQGIKAVAGTFDDPFYFDLNSFNDGATFCQPGDSDFFRGLNTSAIVVEVPTSWFPSPQIGVWGNTYQGSKVVDRMGRPAINTVFNPPNPFEPSPPDPKLEDAFNQGHPSNDVANFKPEVVDTLTLLFSLNDATDLNTADDGPKIQALAGFLLPDILTVDLSKQTAYPNGRGLPDDVIDISLGLITEGLITTDCVGNTSTFNLYAFPYLQKAN
ncbi:MAG: hypothetical protein DCC58_07170 [Chloroflexi bacterium]|nr:MAG: hypothetical protein DCC58_07170 [Chloroflexota bacterium]